jgi:hypothetical protein
MEIRGAQDHAIWDVDLMLAGVGPAAAAVSVHSARVLRILPSGKVMPCLDQASAAILRAANGDAEPAGESAG